MRVKFIESACAKDIKLPCHYNGAVNAYLMTQNLYSQYSIKGKKQGKNNSVIPPPLLKIQNASVER